ncbi:MAG: flagellar M-ring protein FliF [Deltaproteobacteria bacterium]|nr:flagellar M-ring protein FliF [Deltaproteobacteria bacterium]
MANILERLNSLSTTRKVLFAGLLAVSIAGVVTLFTWASKPEYQVLFTNLSQEDSALIIEKLKEKRIPYRIEGQGAVFVPMEQVYETRIELAGIGLPKGGGVGFEIFDKTSLGMTEFVQKVNYMRALQGELARTISGLSEVQNARVHIVVPEKRLFLDDQEPARASVVLSLKQGRTITASEVQGIVHLVASGVSGLNPKNVTVVDTQGKLLTRATDEKSIIALTSSQLEYQRTIEKDFEARIEGILLPVVGHGKVIARVSTDIDFKQVEKTEERFDPDNVVVRSEQINQEKSTGASYVSGVPGITSNTPGNEVQTSVNLLAPQSQRKNEVINYEINKVVSRTIEPSGLIKRLSVAVLVDGSYGAEAEGQAGQKKYIPRAEGDLAKFSGLVKGAIGFDALRGDTVEVVNIPFGLAAVEGGFDTALDARPFYEEMLPYMIRYGAVLVMAAFLYLLVLRPVIKGVFSEVVKEGGTLALSGATMRGLPAGAGASAEAMKAFGAGMAISPAEEAKQKIEGLVKENPKQAATVVRSWLREKGVKES